MHGAGGEVNLVVIYGFLYISIKRLFSEISLSVLSPQDVIIIAVVPKNISKSQT